eukprot:7375875-Prymnesium_polylepis.4
MAEPLRHDHRRVRAARRQQTRATTPHRAGQIEQQPHDSLRPQQLAVVSEPFWQSLIVARKTGKGSLKSLRAHTHAGIGAPQQCSHLGLQQHTRRASSPPPVRWGRTGRNHPPERLHALDKGGELSGLQHRHRRFHHSHDAPNIAETDLEPHHVFRIRRRPPVGGPLLLELCRGLLYALCCGPSSPLIRICRSNG